MRPHIRNTYQLITPYCYSLERKMSTLPKVLSIQSYTVHGYVGNKMATLPLQCMGYDVDTINTITLSNPPNLKGGYMSRETKCNELSDIVDGLAKNSVLNYDIVLSGYCRSVELLRTVEGAIIDIKKRNPSVFICCDPVLGDDDKYYVPPELLHIYKSNILPHATVTTPNKFEAEQLAGMRISTIQDATEACRRIHDFGAQICIIKGLQLAENKLDTLSMILSNQIHIWRVDVLKIPRKFSGCGDLTSALVSGLLHKYPDDPAVALEETAHIMQHVLSSSHALNSADISIPKYVQLFLDPPEVPAISRAFLSSGDIQGVIFDMDGTLTEPGAIDFKSMYTRIGITRRPEGDIIKQVHEELPLVAPEMPLEGNSEFAGVCTVDEALDIICDEEMKGCERTSVRGDLPELISQLTAKRIRLAVSTRNCLKAYESFALKAKIDDDVFSPVVSRDCLNGINKPDPRVATHIMQHWDIQDASKVWFVGDSVDDMLCGKGAGCRTCLIETPYNVKNFENFKEYVDLRVSSLSQFCETVLS